MSADPSFPDQLPQCRTHEERAMWLLSRPLIFLHFGQSHIRYWLRAAGFDAGIAYLDAELAQLWADRPLRHDADITPMTICAARGQMKRVALGLPPTGF